MLFPPPPVPPPPLLEAGVLEDGVDDAVPRDEEPLEVLVVAVVVEAAPGLEVEDAAAPPEDLGVVDADDEKRLPRAAPFVAAPAPAPAPALAVVVEEEDGVEFVALRPGVDGVDVDC